MVPGYLEGKIYDNILIWGVFLVSIISGVIVVANPNLFYIILILDLWFLGYHHVISTDLPPKVGPFYKLGIGL
jgi:hypothetical protein